MSLAMPSVLRVLLIACSAVHAAAAWGSQAEDELEIYHRCIASEQRAHELAFGDSQLLKRARTQSVPVPQHFSKAFGRLLKAAQVPKGVQVELVGVHSNGSASVLSSGTIFVSSKLWRGAVGFEEDEVAAILAHEIAHLEMSHVRHRLCEAVAAAGDENLALAAATQAVHQAIWAGNPQLAMKIMQKNHSRELDADRRAVELVEQARYRREAVTQMLLKIARMASTGYSWSHPAMEVRLENLGMTLKGHGAPF